MGMEFYWIPVKHGEAQQEALNAALKRLRVVAVERHFCPGPPAAGWAVCLDHADAAPTAAGTPRAGGRDPRKVDYREVGSAGDFQIYSTLRDWRRAVAANEGIPIYAVMNVKRLAAAHPRVEPAADPASGAGHFGAARSMPRRVLVAAEYRAPRLAPGLLHSVAGRCCRL